MIWTDCYKELVEIIRSKDGFLASIPDEYSELRERMENTPEIEHIDMWHEQVSFLDEEHPFSSPAVFIEFNTLGIEDEGLLVQRLHTQIDFRLFYETFSDTCEGAEMQEEALSFLDLLTLLGMMLHGNRGRTSARSDAPMSDGKSREVRETCTGSALNVKSWITPQWNLQAMPT